MKIVNGRVYTPQFCFEKKTVSIRDGRFSDISVQELPAGQEKSGAQELPDGEEAVLDASGCYVIPGLIDIHFHGCMGSDFCDGTPEAIRTIAQFEAKEGVTAICPATLTLPAEELTRILSCAAAYVRSRHVGSRSGADRAAGPEADLIGINMEGPFISHVKKGAQNEKYILPCSTAAAGSFLDASEGLVKIIGLAPEENPDYETYIQNVRERVRVSLAHTNADYETAMAAFAAGASHAVHLFNAMPEPGHREPGVVGAFLDSPGVTAELICDGNHVHPALVRALFASPGTAERLVLISDSLRACGLGDGRMILGGLEVEVKGTRAVLTDSGALAGSVCSLTRCLQIAVKEMHIPLEKAVRSATINPARVIGAAGSHGSIEPGKRGNAVLLDEKTLEVRGVVKDGVLIPGTRC